MSSTPKSRPGSAGLAGHVQRISSQRPPPPKGKGLAMIALAAAVLIAVAYQFATGSGPAAAVRKQHEDRAAPTRPPVAPRGPTPPVTTTRPYRPLPALPTPGEAIEVPEGLDARTSGRLLLALNALALPGANRGEQRLIETGLRDLPYVVTDAPEAMRSKLRVFVVERLVPFVGRPVLGVAALDAGLELAKEGAADLAPLIEAAIRGGLAANETAAAALVFLRAIPAEARPGSDAAIAAIVSDDDRPLHLRMLAGQSRE